VVRTVSALINKDEGPLSDPAASPDRKYRDRAIFLLSFLFLEDCAVHVLVQFHPYSSLRADDVPFTPVNPLGLIAAGF